MELRQLEYFTELCRVRNFTRASENLNVAQPSITKSIQKLEEELGVRLIDRRKKPLGLTPAGEQFYLRTTDILTQLEDAAAEAAGETSIHSALNLGISPMAGIVLDEMLNDRQSVAQGIFYNIIHRSGTEIIDRLLKRELDMGLVIRRDLPPELEFFLLETQEALCVLPLDSPLAKRSPLTFEDLKGQPFSMELSPGKSILARFICERCLSAGFTPPTGNLVQNYHPTTRLSIAWIMRGVGISFMPEHAVRKETSVAVRSMEPPITFSVGLVCHRDANRPVQLKRLITYIQRRYPGYAKEYCAK